MATEQGAPVGEPAKLNKVEAIKKAKDGLDVWEDIFRYAKTGFGSIPEEDFVRLRWFGIYQQMPNAEGHFMLRIRIPNGILRPEQLREIGKLAETYARGFGDITTRQCIQLHWLTIEALADILPRLAKVGLVSKFACGDTPRNVVGCPLAGVSADEILDATGVVDATNQMFLDGGKEFSNFPRKFKSAISGCHLHCPQPQINDVGVFGVTRKRADGTEERGYGIVVGGGLSTTPHMAQGLRVFLKPEQIAAVSRGVAHVFRDFGYREKRTRARLKFLVADWGWEKFREALEKDLGYGLEHDESIVAPVAAPHTDHMGVGRQKQAGLCYVGVSIERGRVTAEKMLKVADLAGRFGNQNAEIRLSNKQNLIFVNIPEGQVAGLSKELEAIGLSAKAPLWRANLVSCTGTQFCNLAIVETKERAARILKFLEETCEIDSPIMVSVTGCPNSCSQYQIADIGLMGVVCNFRGQRGTEAYNILLGGGFGANAGFGQLTLKKVPAEYVQKAIFQIVEAYKAHRTDSDETFRAFVQRQTPEQLTKWLTISEMAEVA